MLNRSVHNVALVLLVLLAITAPAAHAVAQWQRYELEIKTPVRYDLGNPYRDLQLVAYWSPNRLAADPAKPSGFGFWDGTRVEGGQTFNIFRIRAALPQGIYYLWYKCSGTTANANCAADSALNLAAASSLSFQVTPNSRPDNRLYTNGFLKVPTGARYLTFTGNPAGRFYWQGDTAWTALAREGKAMVDARAANPALPAGAVSAKWKAYIDDRAKATKGYTVVQVATAVGYQPVNRNQPKKPGCTDTQKSVEWDDVVVPYPPPEVLAFQQLSATGCVGVVPNNCSRWRPELWREVDAMVEYANSRGIVMAIVGVADPSDRGHCLRSESYPTQDDSVIFARNLAARLAGNHVIFSINFDDWPDATLDYDGRWPGTVHDTTLRVGAELQRVVPRHLVTNHMAGSAPVSAYTRYHGLSWLAFHLYQSGHALNLGTSCPGLTGTTWQNRQKCAISRALDFTKALRALNPAKPVVNGEGPYEYPQRGDNALPPDNRYGMRHAAHASLFTGSAGFTIGVHGDDPPRVAKDEASIVAWDNPLDVLQSDGATRDIPGLNRLLMSLYPSGTKSWGEFIRADGIVADIPQPVTGPEPPGERRLVMGSQGGDYVVFVPNSLGVKPAAGLRSFDCRTWQVQWRDPTGLSAPTIRCPVRRPPTQFNRPVQCGDVVRADQTGACDLVMVLRKPQGSSPPPAPASAYIASSLLEATGEEGPLLVGGGDQVTSHLMSGDDEPLTPELTVSPAEEAFYGLPGVFAEPLAGVSWIVWEAAGSSAGESTDIFARRVGLDGSPLGEVFRINQEMADRQYDPFTVVDAVGNVTILWAGVTNQNPDKPKADIFARRFKADGTPLGNELMVNAASEKNQESPVGGADAAGNLVVGWLDKDKGVRIRLFSSDGAPRSGEIAVSAAPQRKLLDLVEVAVDPLGGFVVRWNEYSEADELLSWYSRSFDGAGQFLGDVVQEGP